MANAKGSFRAPARPLDQGALARGYADGAFTPSDVVTEVHAAIEGGGAEGVWISVLPLPALQEAARGVERRRRAGEPLPLYGVPFAIKDNIDLAGLPTTAACPAFAYTPDRSARAVARLIAAGAIPVGKTNLDQFASGLVGVRSPYGVPRNPFHRDYIVGGSSSGSAVAVALGQVSFALGTDTAGSGRVPAAFNNIVGLKPSRGVISTVGVVPACRSLDCVSVFAATCEDAARVAEAMRGYDAADPFAKAEADSVRFWPDSVPATFRFGVPPAGEREFLGDRRAAEAFEAALAACIRLGGVPVDVSLAPFREAGSFLYDGPLVAERLEAAGRLFAERPEALVPPLRTILEGAQTRDARAAYAAEARLRLLRRRLVDLWPGVDFLLVPSAPTLPRISAVERDPLGVNASLGLYTNFVNLLDLAALAVPSGFRDDGLPAGVTLLGPWGGDARLAGFGARIHRATSATVGATEWPLPPVPHGRGADLGGVGPGGAADEGDSETAAAALPADAVSVAVVGAHLSGEPLNHQLTSLGACLLGAAQTKPRYRLFVLPGATPPKPGMVRTSNGTGVAIDVEVWGLSPQAFGTFVDRVPGPLCIGKVELEDGRVVNGFLCEAHATTGARDISSFGGWRAYRRSGS